MLFNSLQYAVFLPIVFCVYWFIPNRFRWLVLLISSYYFYMSWNPKYVILILGTSLLSYLAGLFIERSREKKQKKFFLILYISLCLGLLFTFKYLDFAVGTICSLIKLFAVELHLSTLNLLLPVGISFYTFQTISYVVDVYREDISAEHHFGYYATFVSFFPQLVAGPIERTSNLLPQIKSNKVFSYENGREGLILILIGLFKKVLLADTLAKYVDKVYSNLEKYTGFSLMLVIVFFSIQIYGDFSGYSDIAIGSAKLMGINLMTNFGSPYFSQNIKEFWNRWHISLSNWLKDYIYIPLGGNRKSCMRTNINLLITFLISGLWHGASWNFVIWGGLPWTSSDCYKNVFSR